MRPRAVQTTRGAKRNMKTELTHGAGCPKLQDVRDPCTCKHQMVDVRSPNVVEVETDTGGSKLWVNVDGICLFRAYDIEKLSIKTTTKLITYEPRRGSRVSAERKRV